MFGVDDRIASLSDGGSVLVVLLVALLLGLRHATDPDHIAAVTTLVASTRERATQRAAQLGAWWGLGHALTLIVFGVPIVLFERYLPEPLQRGAETAVGALIVFLATRLLIRWRSGYFHVHAHAHPRHEHDHRHPVRSPLGAFGIGLVHGMGGSAGVGVLLLAALPSRPLAVASLVVLAVFTAVPTLGVSSLAFGVWYALAAWALVPYPFWARHGALVWGRAPRRRDGPGM